MRLLNKRYLLMKQLGEGGMGIVHKAMDTLLGNRFVAVKEMSQRNLSQRDAIDVTNAFKREALLLASLNHQNLPRIYDHFSENGSSYLVMDFIEGETLAQLLSLAHGEGLYIEEVLLIAEQLCSVLGYLHTRQPPVIFRDIKPANVMATTSGDHLYLIDFGIARLFKLGQVKDTLAFGTMGYAPPEQYHRQTTERSDIYSLGVTLHQLLTGLDPTQSTTPFAFAPIKPYNPHTPPRLEELIMQMVQPDAAKRPASIQFIKQVLQRIKQQLLQPPPSVSIPSVNRNTKEVVVPPRSKPMRGTTLCTYRNHTDSIHTTVWSPDGRDIASGGRDKTVQVWEADTGKRCFSYKSHSSYVYGVAWSPDGTRLASTSFGTVHLWDAFTGGDSLSYQGHSLWVYAVAWSPSGSFLVSGGADGEVHVWNAHTGEVICKYQGYSRAVRTVAWSRMVNSTKILSGCDDATLYCWDTATESLPVIYEGHTKEISCVSWSPDDTKIASASRDKTVRVWDAVTGKVLYTYYGHKKEVTGVAWSPDGAYIASVGEDKGVKVWDAMNGNLLYVYQGHTRDVYSLSWSPDGSRIASASDDRTVQVWQI